MIDILDVIASIQAHGGLLLVIIYGVIELRRLRRDFNVHEHGQDGRAVIKMRRVED
jgi:hypothetical protein